MKQIILLEGATRFILPLL